MAILGLISLPFSSVTQTSSVKEINFCEKLNLELSFLKLCNDKIVTHMGFLFK